MFKAIAIIGVLQMLTILVQIVRAKAISVTLGPAGLGIVGLIDQLVLLIATVCALSLPTVVLRTMPRVYGEPEFGRQYAAFLKVVVVATVIGSAAFGIVLLVQPTAFGEVPAAYATEVGIALASVPLTAIGLLLPNVLAASMRPVGAAWLAFSVAAVAAVAAGAGILWGGILEIYIAQAIGLGAVLGAALLYFRLKLQLPFHDPSASLIGEIRARPDIIATSVALYATVVGLAFSLLVVRYVTVDSIGIEAGGLLQAILSTVLAVGAVLIAMGMRYLFPLLNRPGPVAEKFAIAEEFRRRQLMILIALTVPLVLFADIVLMIMFSSKFMVAAAWLPAFLVWQLLVVQSNVQMQLLFAMDDLWIVTFMQIGCSLLSSILCVVLIPSFGLSGAAAALIAGFALMIAVGAERLRRRHGYGIDGSSILLGGYATVVLLGAPYAMHRFGWDAIPLKIAVCAVLIAGLLPFLRPEEKAALKNLGRRSSVDRAAG